MCVLGSLPDLRVPPGEKQGIGIADFCLDQAEIARGIEQARVPPLPIRQQFFYLCTQIHYCNVYEPVSRNNDRVPFMDRSLIYG